MSLQEPTPVVAILLSIYLCCTIPASSCGKVNQALEHGGVGLTAENVSKVPGVEVGANETEVYARFLYLLKRYWRNDWSNVPPEYGTKMLVKEQQALDVYNANSTCLQGWEYLASHWSETDLGFYTPLALQAVDAFGRPGAGILEGNIIAYGSYDECLSIDHVHYCLALITTPITPLAPARVGMCLPQECTKQDIIHATKFVNGILKTLNLSISVYTDSDMIYCEDKKTLPYNAGAIVMLAVCAFIGLLVLFASGLDWLFGVIDDFKSDRKAKQLLSVNPDLERSEDKTERTPLLGTSSTPVRKRPVAFEMLTAFSLFKTIPVIFSTKQPPGAITCIHGIRVISMFWVILGHTHLWAVTQSGVTNFGYLQEHVDKRFSYQAVLNGFLSVDSFFFLTGLLVSYLTLRQMRRKNGRFAAAAYYIHRYLRLTPSFAFVLFFFWFLTSHLGNGPSYHMTTGPGSIPYKNCECYWWTNLLYINNLYPWHFDDECMGWTWYLANDMQFYVVSPLMIVLLYFNPILGFLSVGVFLAGSFSATGAIVGYYGLEAAFEARLPYPNITVSVMDEIYVKPYARIMPHLVGIVLGYFLYKNAKIPYRKLYNWLIYIPMWILAAFFGMVAVYGLYGTLHGHEFSTAENVMYITFCTFTWAVGLALVVFICHNGYGWLVNSFLSLKIWVPLSRLTFTAYLVHEVVLTVFFGNLRHPVEYTDITMGVYVVGLAVISYAAAAVVAAFVEFPLSNLEAILFRMLKFGTRESGRWTDPQLPGVNGPHGFGGSRYKAESVESPVMQPSNA